MKHKGYYPVIGGFPECENCGKQEFDDADEDCVVYRLPIGDKIFSFRMSFRATRGRIMTLKEFSKLSGISISYLQKIESGTTKDEALSLGTLRKLVDAMKLTSVDDLIK